MSDSDADSSLSPSTASPNESDVDFSADSDSFDEDFIVANERESDDESELFESTDDEDSLLADREEREPAGPPIYDNPRDDILYTSDETESEDEGEQNNDSIHSTDTEPYNVDELMPEQHNHRPHQMRANQSVMIINDNTAGPLDADDDVVIIGPHIETIDLCTQPFLAPRPPRMNNLNDVIEILDSPVANRQSSTRSTRNENQRSNLDLNETLNSSQPAIRISCPICLESVINKEPQSTSCGHIFCKTCLLAALRTSKHCPMCRKTLRKNDYHNIHLS